MTGANLHINTTCMTLERVINNQKLSALGLILNLWLYYKINLNQK